MRPHMPAAFLRPHSENSRRRHPPIASLFSQHSHLRRLQSAIYSIWTQPEPWDAHFGSSEITKEGFHADHRDHQSKGRLRKNDHQHQPGRLPGPLGQKDAAGRYGPPGPLRRWAGCPRRTDRTHHLRRPDRRARRQAAKISEIVWQIASDFDLAPSNIKLAAFEQVFAGRPAAKIACQGARTPVKGNLQVVHHRLPAERRLITFNALRACDEVIVPVETGYFSLHGLAKMMETLEVLRDRCGKEILIRVLPTLYDTRTKLAREVLSELRAKFRDYLMESTVNFNTKLKEAASFGQPITEYDPGSRGYKDFVNLARELMGHRPVDIEPTPTKSSRGPRSWCSAPSNWRRLNRSDSPKWSSPPFRSWLRLSR
jgi:cellulose biosynthesis protein BcsQ